jgi:8-oxo-dGTP pyrophosphatase MutT (NUDIX family)
LAALAIYWIIAYHIKTGKASEFKEYLASENFKRLRRELLEETGIRIVETFLQTDPSSSELTDYDAWDVWELPNYAAIDKYEGSKAQQAFFKEYLGQFVGPSYKWITAQKQEYLW